MAKAELDLKIETQKPIQKPKATIYVINEKNLSFDNRVKIDCETISNDPFTTLEWNRSDLDMPIESSIIENSLIIDNFSVDDLGEYICVVKNRVDQTVQKILFYEEKGQLKYLINSNGTNIEFLTTEATTVVNLTNEKNDQRFKFLFDATQLKIGDPLAIECFNLCNLKK